MFSFTTANNGKTPVILPIFIKDITPTGRKPYQGLTAAQRRGVKNVLKGKLPKKGFLPVFSSDALVLLQLFKASKKTDLYDLREAALQVFGLAEQYQTTDLLILPSTLTEIEQRAYVEGISLGIYDLEKYKGKNKFAKKDDKKEEDDKKTKLKKVIFFGKTNKKTAEYLTNIQAAVALTKDLINFPPMDVTPNYLAKTAKQLAKDYKNVTTKILGEKELKKLACGGILGVGQGSDEESHLLVIEYKGNPKQKQPIVLVGKGVTYDTGGYSLKPSRYMRWMKQDMGGAGTVIGALKLIAAQGIKKNVTVVVPTVENKVSSKAYLPDDVLTMYNGLTVEVDNTDAEGRLILADALAYAADKLKPAIMLDLATLTGACEYAVGDDYTSILTNNQKLCDAVLASGKKTDELVWQLPLHKRYKKHFKSTIANMVNSTHMKPGTIEGGLFLEHFVAETPWCHLDIASVTFDEKAMLATGRNLRMLADFVENYKTA